MSTRAKTGLLMALVAAVMVGGRAAQATTYTETVTIDNSAPACILHNSVEICLSGVLFSTPITVAVGDIIDLTATLTQRQYVPGSSTYALESVALFDPNISTDLAFEPGYEDAYTNTILGYQGPPLSLTFSGLASNGAGYGAFNGFYLQPSSGFSYTGTHTIFQIVTADPYPLYGALVGYNVVTEAPEPAVWALMALGVGVLGFASRRRRFRIGSHRFAAGCSVAV